MPYQKYGDDVKNNPAVIIIEDTETTDPNHLQNDLYVFAPDLPGSFQITGGDIGTGETYFSGAITEDQGGHDAVIAYGIDGFVFASVGMAIAGNEKLDRARLIKPKNL